MCDPVCGPLRLFIFLWWHAIMNPTPGRIREEPGDPQMTQATLFNTEKPVKPGMSGLGRGFSFSDSSDARWQGNARLRWSPQDIESVAEFLANRYYKVPH
jgi:hypothetical protein